MDNQLTDRIDELARQARADRDDVAGRIDSVPDESLAMEYLRTGAGKAVWIYIEARTGGRRYAFSTTEFERLERAMNDWLECYARCYGVALEADFSIRTAAEALIETRNVRDMAETLTTVPRAEH